MNRLLTAALASASLVALGACADAGYQRTAANPTGNSVAEIHPGADPDVVRDAAIGAGANPDDVERGVAASGRPPIPSPIPEGGPEVE